LAPELFQFEETPDSRAWSTDPLGLTYRYKATGEHSDSTVLAYALSATPAIFYTSFGALYRGNLEVDPDGHKQYIVTVPYGITKNDTGSVSFRFDTTGATINIKASKEHIASFPAGSPTDPHKGSIGVTKKGDVEGADIVVPALKLTYSFKHPAGVINESHARLLASVTGQTNSEAFRGFEPGELLYIGSTGEDGSETDASVDYVFVASQNATGLTIGDIVDIAKNGHDYLWIEFKNETESGQPAVQPERVHIERVYDSFDFAAVFGWE
jgi:hypothetical protein